jgi:hypothetical protein
VREPVLLGERIGGPPPWRLRARALCRHIGGPAWMLLIELDRLIFEGRGKNPVKLTNRCWKAVGLSHDAKTRALRQLEAAGVISIEQRPSPRPTQIPARYLRRFQQGTLLVCAYLSAVPILFLYCSLLSVFLLTRRTQAHPRSFGFSAYSRRTRPSLASRTAGLLPTNGSISICTVLCGTDEFRYEATRFSDVSGRFGGNS